MLHLLLREVKPERAFKFHVVGENRKVKPERVFKFLVGGENNYFMLHLLLREVKPVPLYPHIEMLGSVKAMLLEQGLLRSAVYSFLLLRIIGFVLGHGCRGNRAKLVCADLKEL